MLKKSLICLTSSLIMMNMGTSFANENPFDDVPQDHWSRTAIVDLVNKGVIKGYDDNTFKGDQKITRFEMAQMVAKAMANENLSKEDKQELDKLQKEYHDELDNLGVKITKLEERSSNMKFNMNLTQKYMGGKQPNGPKEKAHYWEKYLSIGMEAPIGNSGYTMHALYENKHAGENLNHETQSSGFGTNGVSQAWIEGNLGKTGQYAKLGSFSPWSQKGFVYDGKIIGGELTHWYKAGATHFFGGRVYESEWDLGVPGSINWDKGPDYTTPGWSAPPDWTWHEGAEHWSTKSNAYSDFTRHHKTTEVIRGGDTNWEHKDPTGEDDYGGVYKYDAKGNRISDSRPTLWGAGYEYNFSPNLQGTLAYYNFKSDAYGGDPLEIYSGMLNYKVGKDLNLQAQYAHGNQGGEDNAWNIELQYKGTPWINNRIPHNFGAYVGYRYMAPDAIVKGNFDGVLAGQKGLEIGMFYTFDENVNACLKYAFGEAIASGEDRDRLFASVSYEFF